MLIIADAPDQHQAGERDDRSSAAARTLAARADLLTDEAEERRQSQSRDEYEPDERINDVNEVPLIPAIVKRLEETNAVGCGVVQKKMT